MYDPQRDTCCLASVHTRRTAVRAVYGGFAVDVGERLESARKVGRSTCRDDEDGCSCRLLVAKPVAVCMVYLKLL